MKKAQTILILLLFCTGFLAAETKWNSVTVFNTAGYLWNILDRIPEFVREIQKISSSLIDR